MILALSTSLLIVSLVTLGIISHLKRRPKNTKPASTREIGSTTESVELCRQEEGQLLEQAKDALLNGKDALARDLYRQADSTKGKAIRLRMQRLN